MAPDLVQQTRKLLKSSKQPKPAIAEAAGVSLRYLYMLENDEVRNPTLGKILGLYEYLSKAARPRKSRSN